MQGASRSLTTSDAALTVSDAACSDVGETIQTKDLGNEPAASSAAHADGDETPQMEGVGGELIAGGSPTAPLEPEEVGQPPADHGALARLAASSTQMANAASSASMQASVHQMAESSALAMAKAWAESSWSASTAAIYATSVAAR